MIDQWKKGAKYWDKAWNPVVGCRKCSEGCVNCYAESIAKRFNLHGGEFNPVRTNEVNPPRKGVVFVGNMTDLFGKWNTDRDIYNWLAELSPEATNLILTKRAERMATMDLGFNLDKWFGVTCENQQRADERIPSLLKTNVTRKWLSLEPLLGEIDIRKYFVRDPYYMVKCNYCGWIGSSEYCPGGDDYYTCPECFSGEPQEVSSHINWVVVGAESLGSRPGRECKIEWIESIVEQCRTANVPVFVKQIHLNGKLVKDINQFPEHLQIRQLPFATKRTDVR